MSPWAPSRPPEAAGPWMRLLAALAVAAVVLAALPARADPPARVGRLADVQGQVWGYDAERGEWSTALRNRPITAGDRIATDPGARTAVQVGSATLRLGGASEVEWTQLDDDAVRVRVLSGSVALRVLYADVAHEFQLLTPHGRLLPLFAGHYRVDLLSGATAVEVLMGEAVFDAVDSRKNVASGQRLEFWQRGEPPRTLYDVVTTPLDDFGRWLLAVQRDEPRDPYARRYVSPETTGWEDLDRYGRWDRHPEYGAIWYPAGVAIDWAPYRYGRWVWVRPWGWTWVDDAPWGFAPFHYGRWVWWQGRWAWWPGAYVARPVYSPALVGWIGGSNVSIGISIGTGPWLGWVPLSPYDVYQPWYPVKRRPGHAPEPVPPPRRPPREHASGYVHLNVPGGVTVATAGAFQQHRAVGPNEWRRVDPDAWRRQGGAPRFERVTPPAPTLAPPTVAAPVVPPRPPRAVPPGWPDRDRGGGGERERDRDQDRNRDRDRDGSGAVDRDRPAPGLGDRVPGQRAPASAIDERDRPGARPIDRVDRTDRPGERDGLRESWRPPSREAEPGRRATPVPTDATLPRLDRSADEPSRPLPPPAATLVPPAASPAAVLRPNDRLGAERATDRPFERPIDRAADRATERGGDRPVERSFDRLVEPRAMDRPAPPAVDARPPVVGMPPMQRDVVVPGFQRGAPPAAPVTAPSFPGRDRVQPPMPTSPSTPPPQSRAPDADRFDAREARRPAPPVMAPPPGGAVADAQGPAPGRERVPGFGAGRERPVGAAERDGERTRGRANADDPPAANARPGPGFDPRAVAR